MKLSTPLFLFFLFLSLVLSGCLAAQKNAGSTETTMENSASSTTLHWGSSTTTEELPPFNPDGYPNSESDKPPNPPE